MTMTVEGTPISIPEDFPVAWESPGDERIFWFWDQMHHPHVVTPMTSSLDGPAFTDGFGRACRAMSMPLKTSAVRTFNYYLYFGNVPLDEDTAEAAAREMRMAAQMARRAPRIMEDWETVYLPEVMRLNARLRDYPYSAASPRELAEFLEEAVEIRAQAWDLHFQTVMPAMGAATEFASLYERTFGTPTDNEHYRMLQGFPNKSVEAGQALYDLAQEVKARPALAQAVAEAPPGGIFPYLEASTSGQDLAGRLRAYLDDYGWRSDQFELRDPSWREDPRPVLSNLKAYLRDGAVDPRSEQAKAAAERERLVAGMLERAPDEAARQRLGTFHKMAQAYLPIQENHNFYIDQMNTVLLRCPVLEIGRRLTAGGAVADPDDAFLLTVGEAQEAVLDPRSDWSNLVATRKSEMARWSRVVPPQFLGTRPPADPRQDVVDRFWGLDREPSHNPKVITGHGASRGVVTGTAKVIRSLAEADKLEQGDILVCEMTMPPWTPLFSVVSAVVADSGGVLSHCAIVAREYGIPCVTGTRVGTQRIRDGQMLTVDGAKGIVRIDG